MTIRRTRQALGSALLGVLLLAGSLFGYQIQQTQAAAGIPLVVNYQARVTDPAGTPITAATDMRFIIWDAAAAGNCVWSAYGTGVNGCSVNPEAGDVAISPVSGVFSFGLGDTTLGGQNALQSSIFSDDARYLEVQMFNGATWETLSPRKRLTSAPYSMNANLLDGLDTSAAGGATAFVPVTDGSGNFLLTKNLTVDTNTLFVDSATHRVGIGNIIPTKTLDIAGTEGITTTLSPGGNTASLSLNSTVSGTIGVNNFQSINNSLVFDPTGVSNPFSNVYGTYNYINVPATNSVNFSVNSLHLVPSYNYVKNQSSGNAGEYLIGSWNKAEQAGSGTMHRTYGAWNEADMTNGAGEYLTGSINQAILNNGTTTSVAGVDITDVVGAWPGQAASTGNVYGVRSNNSVVAWLGTASATNVYDFYSQNSTPNAAGYPLNPFSFGTIQNYYGMYIEEHTHGVNNWNLYSVGGKNYFGGNVGIGATVPTYALSFGNTQAQTIWVENTDNTVAGKALTLQAGSTLTGGTSDLAGGNLILSSGAGTGTGASTISFFTGTTLTTGNTLQTLSEKMTILGNGNVGIGTPTPTYTLHVNQGAKAEPTAIFSSTNTLYGTQFVLDSTGAGGSEWRFFSTGSANPIGAGKTGFFDATGAGAYRMVIDSSGNVGIGTPSPSARLSVLGTSDIVQMLVKGYSTQTSNIFDVQDTNGSSAMFVASGLFNPKVYVPSDGMVVGAATASSLNDRSFGMEVLDASGYNSGYHTAALVITEASNRNRELLFDVDPNNELGIIKTGYSGGGASSFPGLSISTGVEAIRILNNGFVGIGDTSPAALLTVGNGDKFQVDTSGNLTFNTTATKIDFASTASNTFLWQIPASAGACASAAAEGIRIFEGGNTTTQRGHICISNTNKLNFFAEAFNSTATDVAENYSTDPADGLEPGDIVAIGAEGGLMVKKAVSDGPMAVGVISTRPGIKLTGIDESTGESETTNSMPVALSGRVPVYVSNANGAISVGDPIVASSAPGIGAKATGPGQIIGYALGNYDNAEAGKITVFLQAGWSDGHALSAPVIDNSASELPPGHLANLSADLDLAGFSIRNIIQLSGVNGQWMIDENGVLTQIIRNDNGERTLYASSSQNATVTLFGSGQLEAGQVRVEFTQEQKDVMAPTIPYNVIVTLTGSADGVYVPAKDYDGFQVAELNGGRSGATFDWTVIARRRGYENVNDLGVVPGQPTPIVETPPIVVTPPVVEEPPAAAEPSPVVETPPVETPPIVDTVPDATAELSSDTTTPLRFGSAGQATIP